MQFVVPRGGDRGESPLRVDERDIVVTCRERRQHHCELLKHSVHHGDGRGEPGKATQVKCGLEPGANSADTSAIWNGEIVSVKEQVRARAERVAEADKVLVASSYQVERRCESRLAD